MNLRTYLMIKQAEPISFDRMPEGRPSDPMIFIGNSTLQKHDDAHTPLGKHYTDVGGKLIEPGRYTYIGKNTFSENIPVIPDYQKQIEDATNKLVSIRSAEDEAIGTRMEKNRMSYLKAMLTGAGLLGGGSVLMNMGEPVNHPMLYHGGMTAAGAISGLLTAALYNSWLRKHKGRTPIQSLWHNTVERPIDFVKNIGTAPATEEDWARLNKLDAIRQRDNPKKENREPVTDKEYKEWNRKGNPPVIL